MTYWEMESEFLWGQTWNQELFIVKGRAFIGFQRSLKPKTEWNSGSGARHGWRHGEGHFNRHMSFDPRLQLQGNEAGQHHNLVPPNSISEGR